MFSRYIIFIRSAQMNCIKSKHSNLNSFGENFSSVKVSKIDFGGGGWLVVQDSGWSEK
jgi:hypothetical protein